MNEQPLKCLLVDDEPPAIRLLENYLSKVPFLEATATASSAFEALKLLEKSTIDVIFLDIQMPDLSGIQLSKIIKGQVKIIFTTAYPQFAIESYDLNAVDYLLKPFEFERFYEAALKLKALNKQTVKSTSDTPYLFIKTDGKNNFEKVYVDDIYFVEGLKNYVAIHLANKQIITYNTLKNIEESLQDSGFIKIHKSYIVSLNKINKTDSLSVFINNKELPIGDTYKKDFFEAIHKREL